MHHSHVDVCAKNQLSRSLMQLNGQLACGCEDNGRRVCTVSRCFPTNRHQARNDWDEKRGGLAGACRGAGEQITACSKKWEPGAVCQGRNMRYKGCLGAEWCSDFMFCLCGGWWQRVRNSWIVLSQSCIQGQHTNERTCKRAAGCKVYLLLFSGKHSEIAPTSLTASICMHVCKQLCLWKLIWCIFVDSPSATSTWRLLSVVSAFKARWHPKIWML